LQNFLIRFATPLHYVPNQAPQRIEKALGSNRLLPRRNYDHTKNYYLHPAGPFLCAAQTAGGSATDITSETENFIAPSYPVGRCFNGSRESRKQRRQAEPPLSSKLWLHAAQA
jgi:hypothetical protein